MSVLSNEEIEYWIGSNSTKKAVARAIEAAVLEKLVEQENELAASQAREQQLLAAIDSFGHNKYCSRGIAFAFNKNTNAECTCYMREALTLPQDTTALSAMIAKAGEVMRERAIKSVDLTPYRLVADERIRALPGVTLEDLKSDPA